MKKSAVRYFFRITIKRLGPLLNKYNNKEALLRSRRGVPLSGGYPKEGGGVYQKRGEGSTKTRGRDAPKEGVVS